MKLTSNDFQHGQPIPGPFTCQGKGVSPDLAWTEPPAGTVSLALLMEDPDAPGGLFTHWMIFHIPPESKGLPRGLPGEGDLDNGAMQGTNDFERIGYGPPCPPPGSPHRYFFRLYALDYQPALSPGVTRTDLLEAISGHVLDEAELMGTVAA